MDFKSWCRTLSELTLRPCGPFLSTLLRLRPPLGRFVGAPCCFQGAPVASKKQLHKDFGEAFLQKVNFSYLYVSPR